MTEDSRAPAGAPAGVGANSHHAALVGVHRQSAPRPLTAWQRRLWRLLGPPPPFEPTGAADLAAGSATPTVELSREAYAPTEHGTLAVRDQVSGAGDPGLAAVPPTWQRQLWRRLSAGNRRRSLLVGMLLALLLAVGGAAAVLRGATVYTSHTVMLIDDPYKLATAGDDGQLVKLSALRYKYQALLETSAMTVPIAHRLGLSPDEVASSVSASIGSQSLLMDVDGTSSTARGAMRLSRAAADEVIAYVQWEDTTYGIPPSSRFQFSVVDPTSPATGSGPSAGHASTLALGLAVVGLVVGFCGTQLVKNRDLAR
jgi:hypothetical protein